MSLDMILRARQQGQKPKGVIVVVGKKQPLDAPWDWVFFENPRELSKADLRPLYRVNAFFYAPLCKEVCEAVEGFEIGFLGHSSLAGNKQSAEFARFTELAMENYTWKS
jgi:hypothetical protein